MVQYTTSGGSDSSALAIVTVDSPKFILAVEPLAALLEFATAPFKLDTADAPQQAEDAPAERGEKDNTPSTLAFRVNIVHATILVLADDSDPKSQVIELSVKEILLSQQSIMALKVDQLGMSFGSMDRSDRVRFLDDLNVAISIDSRRRGSQEMSSYEVEVPDPIIFRASYNNIRLITEIAQKAIAVATRGNKKDEEADSEARRRRSVTDASSTRAPVTTAVVPAQRSITNNPSTRRTSVSRRRRSMDKSKVLVSKEQLKATVNGFQFVLVGDMQEIPMVHLSANEFSLSVQDWSGDVSLPSFSCCR
jgi:vacuolar protein sorting-associated protein 13A/C